MLLRALLWVLLGRGGRVRQRWCCEEERFLEDGTILIGIDDNLPRRSSLVFPFLASFFLLFVFHRLIEHQASIFVLFFLLFSERRRVSAPCLSMPSFEKAFVSFVSFIS